MGAKTSTANGSDHHHHHQGQAAAAHHHPHHHHNAHHSTTSSPRMRTFSSSSSSNAAGSSSSGQDSATSGFNFFRGIPGIQLSSTFSSNSPTNSGQTSGVGGGGGGGQHRARSLSSVPDLQNAHHQVVYDISEAGNNTSSNLATNSSNSNGHGAAGATNSALSTSAITRIYAAASLPAHWSLNDIKCPFCNKFVLSDDIECHLVMCLTKPRLSYNEDVLNDAKGECVICLEDLSPGDIIARLPCLCVYHKGCIDKWFEVNRSCPEHPGD